MEAGLIEAISGLIAGAVYSTLQNGAPASAKWFFIVLGILGAIATVRQVAAASVSFIVGWIFGSWLLKGLWGFLDYVVFVVIVGIVIYVLIKWFSEYL